MAKSQKIVSSHFPYLPVKVAIKKRICNVEVLLDTGFDGEIILPPEMITNGVLPNWHVDCKLADDSVVEIPALFCSVKLGNKRLNNVVLLIMGDEPIIGRSIIEYFKITLDHGRKIILE